MDLKDKKNDDNTDKKLIISDAMNSTLIEICLDMFEGGIELGKKIGHDDGKLNSLKKGTVITEMVKFQKLYDDVIQKYCSYLNR